MCMHFINNPEQKLKDFLGTLKLSRGVCFSLFFSFLIHPALRHKRAFFYWSNLQYIDRKSKLAGCKSYSKFIWLMMRKVYVETSKRSLIKHTCS